MSQPVELPLKQKRTLFLTGTVLLATLFVYAWISVIGERHALRLEVREQGKQSALSLEDAIDVLRSHVFTVRRTAEHGLVRAEGNRRDGYELILAESGALHLDPKADVKPESFKRNLAAASAILPGVAAAHQWNPVFQWSYFYDAKARWFLIYPHLSAEDLFRTTKTGDLSAAIRVTLEGGGTRPIELVGPRNNPTRDMRWTPPYEDAVGKGRMVSLLAPVYLGDEYLGVVGTDVTLKQLGTILRRHIPAVGRSLVVDERDTVLADSGDAMNVRTDYVKVANLFPKPPDEGDPAWQRLPLRGTSWTLWVYATDSHLNTVAVSNLIPSFAVAGLLGLAIFVIVWLQQRRSKDLTATVEVLEETRSALVRADRLGAMGGMVASVSREIEAPLHQSAQTIQALQGGVAVFREQQQRGLRRSELEDFVARVDQSGEQLARQVAEADDLLQRFRQLAVDQASAQARQFRLRDVADNVVAVLRPALKRIGCSVDNAIATELAVTADAGTLGQILHYLLNDAIDRSHPGQTLQFTAGWNDDRSGEVVELVLSDTAGTPPDANAENLLLASRLAQQGLGGQLLFVTSEDGSRITLRMPAVT
jgi:hypothetical protein